MFNIFDTVADELGWAEEMAQDAETQRKEAAEHEQFYDTLEHSDGIPPDLDFD